MTHKMIRMPNQTMRSRLVVRVALLGGLLLSSNFVSADAHESRVWLGVVTVGASFERLAALGLEYGVEVRRVVSQGPAAKAGLRSGDMILAIGQRPVYSVERLSWLMNTLSPGQEVPVEYFRAGERKTVKVALSAAPPLSERFSREQYRTGAPRSYLGVGLQAMTDDLRQAFGVPRDIGVLITQVFDARPAAEGGLMAGDVIVRMDRMDITEVADVYRVLDFFKPGDAIKIELIREKGSETVTVVLAAPPEDRHGQRQWLEPWEPPPKIPVPFLEPHYWQRQLDELLERWREYWPEQPDAPAQEWRL